MNYDAWFLFFLGMVSSILLVNVVQWIMYGERVYGLYVLYTLAWITYFVVRHLPLPDNAMSFARVAGPITAYMFYFALVADFLHVWKQRPKLHRPYQILQTSLILYCLVKAYMCFVHDYWTSATHDLVQNIFRFILIGVAVYATGLFFRSKDPVSRFFVVGTTLMVVTHLVTVSLSVRITDMNYVWNSWRNPYPYMQAGIVLDLMVFSIGLSYRHRREAIRKATVERELDYEREQRHREQLQAELTMQQLKHEKTEMHMRALQSQINPHFLFNSLNSLSALISDNPEKAEQFVDQMSVVYRYLLQAGDRELTTVASELAFIHAYGNLLTTRFGRGISIELAVSDASRDWLLPPLTLQLLVENAVKHNVVHSGKPLRIEIKTDQANRLIVSNNLQRKPIRQVLSSGKGLANINEKYRLLNLPGIKISESADVFSVEIPLIESMLKAA